MTGDCAPLGSTSLAYNSKPRRQAFAAIVLRCTPEWCAKHYSAFFLRRNTMSPRNRTASTAQTMRIIELSIVFFSFPAKSLRYMLFIMGSSSRMIFITTGPTVTTNKEGRMQKKMGKTSFTPSLAAFSSATWRACTRM